MGKDEVQIDVVWAPEELVDQGEKKKQCTQEVAATNRQMESSKTATRSRSGRTRYSFASWEKMLLKGPIDAEDVAEQDEEATKAAFAGMVRMGHDEAEVTEVAATAFVAS